jgi:hypothetical protein
MVSDGDGGWGLVEFWLGYRQFNGYGSIPWVFPIFPDPAWFYNVSWFFSFYILSNQLGIFSCLLIQCPELNFIDINKSEAYHKRRPNLHRPGLSTKYIYT